MDSDSGGGGGGAAAAAPGCAPSFFDPVRL